MGLREGVLGRRDGTSAHPYCPQPPGLIVTQAFLSLSSLPSEPPLSGYASEQLRALAFGYW